MPERLVGGKRPQNLETAPNFLTQVQAAAALGVSVDLITEMENDDPSFPKRQAIWGRRRLFHRDQLLDWYRARNGQHELGGAA